MSGLPKCNCFRSARQLYCDGSCIPELKDTTTNNMDQKDNRFYKAPYKFAERAKVNDSVNNTNIYADGEEIIRSLLDLMQQPYQSEGLKDTPKRVLKFYDQFLHPDQFNFTTFKNEGVDEMVICGDIPFYSLCEHHMVPFFGWGHIAYIPNDKIVGLSKLPRTLDKFARQLQNQERITKQVAEYIMQELNPKGVGVILKARHLCVEMRGVEKPGTMTTTSCMLGVFKTDLNCRQEFLQLVK